MSIIIKLRENNTFSNNERIVSKYILENLKDIRNIDAKNIAENTFVSISTITRMSKRLECSGFKELKMLLIEEIAIIENEENKFNNKEIFDKESVIENLNILSIEALKETKRLQNIDVIETIVDLIDKKNIIDFYGVGASYIVCLDAEYKFLRSGKQTNIFSSFDKQYIQAKNSTKNNLAIIISYSGETNEIIKIVDILNKKGVKTVSITRLTDNTVAKMCDYNLYVTSNENLERIAAIYSRISMLNVIDILYFTYYIKYYDKVNKNIIKTKIN